MKLVGMLDSPYVRRVAISLKRMGIAFEHESVSVFRGMERFREINPVIKAPTFVTDEGHVLMESSLILDYVECLQGPGKGLMPSSLPERTRTLRLTGLALVAYEKAVQIYYERNLRPAQIQHAPWVERVSEQLKTACATLERELAEHPLSAEADIGQDGISIAVGWSFIQLVVPDQASALDYPLLADFAAQAERLDIFTSLPMV
ncbi:MULTISPECIES: glutathione S-transferase N-terminal domain-containing protein [unclassified Pseudomonas]|uniref:glutathione S-transferase family protein n=1 Tax=unclassified Pseudomonas TaxID=196821 RepID=UPI000D3BA6E2|nr:MULTISPECIES: glutathione S-transferase N-terminal domain-containing protein [unclassified Pseudomonas]RAU44292.1 glutathione S-transferase family protein [Pseudomonas sp. RIT 409]RAU51061.1 glutathione S-transferase family protein [Pseudomonas sp. RIT 412]